MITSSYVDPAAPLSTPPRRLDDDVLQNAGEAVLTNPASVDVMPPLATPDASGVGLGARASAALANYQESAMDYVGRKPFQAALLAALAGGVAAALLRSALTRRKN